MCSLRTERQAWQKERLQKAAHDWETYRQVTKPKTQWGPDYFRNNTSPDPTQEMITHFKDLRTKEREKCLDDKLEEVVNNYLVGVVTVEEVVAAVEAGKKQKSVGPDCVSNELPTIVQQQEGVVELTEFFQQVLASGLFAKNGNPKVPRDLRPNALSSHAAKCLVRVLLARVQPRLAPSGKQQELQGGERQALDSILRTGRHVINLSPEWHQPAVLLKTDLRRAFDSVDRLFLARRGKQWMEAEFPHETVCVLFMLGANRMSFQLTWIASNCFAT